MSGTGSSIDNEENEFLLERWSSSEGGLQQCLVTFLEAHLVTLDQKLKPNPESILKNSGNRPKEELEFSYPSENYLWCIDK